MDEKKKYTGMSNSVRFGIFDSNFAFYFCGVYGVL